MTMAKLDVSQEFLLGALFQGEALGVVIRGIRFDRDRGIVELDIEGSKVPDVDRVQVKITQAYTTFEFSAA